MQESAKQPAASTLSRSWKVTLVLAAITAAVVLVLALALGTPVDIDAPTGANGSGLGLAAHAAVASFFGSESDFLATRAELLDALEANHERLAPETLATLLDNLNIIDHSIVEIAAAHAEDPDHPRLSRLLASACQRELELLRRATEVAEQSQGAG